MLSAHPVILATAAAALARINPLEALAAASGVVNIVLLVRRSVWNYPFGLVMVALYAFIYFEARLYSDALLQPFFFAIQLYGWWAWSRADEVEQGVAVERLTGPARLGWLAGIAILSLLWGAAMARYTDAAAPFPDGGIMIGSIAAQILLTRRLIENWVLWIAVDMVSIGLFAAKGLHVTALLYLLFLGLSVAGLVRWGRVLAREGVRS